MIELEVQHMTRKSKMAIFHVEDESRWSKLLENRFTKLISEQNISNIDLRTFHSPSEFRANITDDYLSAALIYDRNMSSVDGVINHDGDVSLDIMNDVYPNSQKICLSNYKPKEVPLEVEVVNKTPHQLAPMLKECIESMQEKLTIGDFFRPLDKFYGSVDKIKKDCIIVECYKSGRVIYKTIYFDSIRHIDPSEFKLGINLSIAVYTDDVGTNLIKIDLTDDIVDSFTDRLIKKNKIFTDLPNYDINEYFESKAFRAEE